MILEPPARHFGMMFDGFSSLFWPHSRGCGLLAFRCSWLRLPPCSGRKARREAAGTHAKRSQLQPPGEAAQRASKGISDVLDCRLEALAGLAALAVLLLMVLALWLSLFLLLSLLLPFLPCLQLSL